mmetsp:Transcript_118160/g.294721  ORF Transcript_118160/g.294721 Transcript_118160/m.294721 type:complete len:255 (+) Transcript_118160:374-1138(+)
MLAIRGGLLDRRKERAVQIVAAGGRRADVGGRGVRALLGGDGGEVTDGLRLRRGGARGRARLGGAEVLAVLSGDRLLLLLADPQVSCHLRGAGPLGLGLAEHGAEVVLALRPQALRIDGLPPSDVGLVSKREAVDKQAVHDHAHGPDIDLHAVVQCIELRRPEHLGTDRRAHPLLLALQHARGPEVTQGDAALRVQDVGPVHHEVVALDIPVDNQVGVEVLDSCSHLRADVYESLAWEGPLSLLRFHPPLQALH